MEPPKPETINTAAIVAAKVITDAADQAKAAVTQAAESAKDFLNMSHERDKRLTQILSDALRDVFGENEQSGKFIDTAKIPLICKDISGIRDTLRLIVDMMEKKEVKDEERFVTKDQFSPVRSIVYTLCGSILLAFLGAVIALVIKN